MHENNFAFVAAAYAAFWLVMIGLMLRVRTTLSRSRDLLERSGGSE
jgi:hypothetical protein